MSGSPGAHFLEVYLLSFIILEDKIQKLLESKGEKVNHKAFKIHWIIHIILLYARLFQNSKEI